MLYEVITLWVHRQQWDLFEQFLGGREGVEPTPEVIREAALFGLDVVGARDAGLLQLPDGPIDFKMGCRVWYLDGEVSREDGPAIDWGQGAQHWFLHGKRHRVDGPAILRANGHQEWWLHDLRHRVITSYSIHYTKLYEGGTTRPSASG